MERRIKEELTKYYEAPKPQRKQAFVRQYGVPKINNCYLTFMQVKYVSKWTWFCSAIFSVLAYLLAITTDEKFVGAVLAVLPFWVMISVTDSMRSYRYGMEELELSARFSLKSIVLARLLVLGVGNLPVLAVLIGCFHNFAGLPMLCIITPYFVTAGGGLYIVRTVKGNESTLYCFGLAMAVSVIGWILQWRYYELFSKSYTELWTVVCIIAVFITVRESYRTIRMTEDLVWNY